MLLQISQRIFTFHHTPLHKLYFFNEILMFLIKSELKKGAKCIFFREIIFLRLRFFRLNHHF
jgi:hypothetical protein